MKKLFYDFHNHSCLSPCADNDMTPNNIAGMAKLAGLQVVALTDHNASKNCPAFFEAANRMGIIPIAGMELTTAEDIHVVFLFPSLEAALDFDADLQQHRILYPNRVDIFGDQLLMNGEDQIVGTEPHFLTNATDIVYEDTLPMAMNYGGVAYPAHVDRMANGVIAVLGTLPEKPEFRQVEFHDFSKIEEYQSRYEPLRGKQIMFGSDAHYLWQIQDAAHTLEVPDEVETPEEVRRVIIQHLRGESR